MALAKRFIDLQFRLGKGNFGADGVDTVELKGLRVSCAISKAGGVSMSECSLRVYGMPLDVMNQLTVINKLAQEDMRFNAVTVSAGDEESGASVCFTGVIKEAWIDAAKAPDVAFYVKAYTGALDLVKPVPPVSYNGTVDAALIVAGIAAQMTPSGGQTGFGGLKFENSGVKVQIAYPYLTGTALEQLRTVARAGNFNCVVDDDTVAIWPAGGVRGGQVPLISAATGMVGYPAFTQNGIQLTTLYNPSLVFGTEIKVESALVPARGRWTIASVHHNLDSETPGGAWFSSVECGLLGQVVAVIG